jgi:hypothetical protein
MNDSQSELVPAQAVPVEQLPAQTQPASVLSGTEIALYVSARLQTEDEKLFAMQAVSGECPEARNLDGKEIECRFIVGCFTKELEDESGEVYLGRKFVFVAPDGSMVKASGKTIPQTVALAASTFGLGPWEPPVRFRVRCKANPPPKSPTVFLDCLGRAKPAGKPKVGAK